MSAHLFGAEVGGNVVGARVPVIGADVVGDEVSRAGYICANHAMSNLLNPARWPMRVLPCSVCSASPSAVFVIVTTSSSA